MNVLRNAFVDCLLTWHRNTGGIHLELFSWNLYLQNKLLAKQLPDPVRV